MTKLAVSALAAAALAACAVAPSAIAQEKPEMPRTLSVSGLGEATAAPDMAMLTIGVETHGATAAEALQKNGVNMRATIDKLKKSGVASKDLQTSNVSVNPQYSYDKNRTKPEIIGFTASNTLNVKLRDLDKAGSIIDDAIGVGANRLGGIRFGFADPKPILNEARRDAIRDARDKATLYADAADVTLGPILQIQDGYAAPRPVVNVTARMRSMEADSTPIEAGESVLSANVTMVYEIR